MDVEARVIQGQLTAWQAEICKAWIEDGYFVARQLIDPAILDEVWIAYERALASGVISIAPEPHGPCDPYPGRRLDPHIQVPEVRELLHNPKLLAITDLLFDRKTLPFQTILGHKGSSQSPHSDAIHMSTYPSGYLIANWIAFEDVHEDSGPLEFYPKSHRLIPPIMSADVGILPGEYKALGPSVYCERYEPRIRDLLAAYKLEPRHFLASKGDVLFWHANLIHGGAARRNLAHSRKALVCHYFAQGAVTYHDLSGNLTRLHRRGMYQTAIVD